MKLQELLLDFLQEVWENEDLYYNANDLQWHVKMVDNFLATQQINNLNIPVVITPLLTDKDIEDDIWENITMPLSKIDIDTQSDNYIKYLNAVHWAKWGRDNCNGL